VRTWIVHKNNQRSLKQREQYKGKQQKQYKDKQHNYRQNKWMSISK